MSWRVGTACHGPWCAPGPGPGDQKGSTEPTWSLGRQSTRGDPGGVQLCSSESCSPSRGCSLYHCALWDGNWGWVLKRATHLSWGSPCTQQLPQRVWDSAQNQPAGVSGKCFETFSPISPGCASLKYCYLQSPSQRLLLGTKEMFEALTEMIAEQQIGAVQVSS